MDKTANPISIKKYYLAAFVAFFLWGFFSLALKPLAHVPAFDILFFRIIFSLVILAGIAVFFRWHILKNDFKTYQSLPKKSQNRAVFFTLSGGLLLGLNWFLFIYVVNQISVQSASYAYLVCPIITTVLSFFILKEKLSKIQIISVFICLIANILYYYANPNNLIFALIVATSYALYLISQRKNTYFNQFTKLIIQILIIGVLSIPYYLYKGFSIPSDFSFYYYVAIVSIFFTVIPLYLNLYALSGANASGIGILMYINPLIAFSLSVFYFHEHLKILQIVSYVLILFAVILYNYQIIFRKKIIT